MCTSAKIKITSKNKELMKRTKSLSLIDYYIVHNEQLRIQFRKILSSIANYSYQYLTKMTSCIQQKMWILILQLIIMSFNVDIFEHFDSILKIEISKNLSFLLLARAIS